MKKVFLFAIVGLFLASTGFVFFQAGISADEVSTLPHRSTVRVGVYNDLNVLLPADHPSTVNLASADGQESVVLTNRDSQGYYIANVRPGTYIVNVSAEGYQLYEREVDVRFSETETLDIHLKSQ